MQLWCKYEVYTNVPHCILIKTKYTEVIKYPCVLQNRACTTDCRCKECSNTFGKRPIMPRKQDRRTHCWQGVSANSYIYVTQSEKNSEQGEYNPARDMKLIKTYTKGI